MCFAQRVMHVWRNVYSTNGATSLRAMARACCFFNNLVAYIGGGVQVRGFLSRCRHAFPPILTSQQFHARQDAFQRVKRREKLPVKFGIRIAQRAK